jgi:hypothetical protein
MKYDVFGTPLEVVNRDGAWKVFYLGTEGKKRPARDIVIPPSISEESVQEYLADLRHEWATPTNQQVIRID